MSFTFRDDARSSRKVRLFFYIVWFVASCLQASFSNLLPDEALYWMYSKHLAWGYFEHAPGVALIIKAGYWLVQSQLGVRLFPILMMCGAIYMLEKIVAPQKPESYYLSVSSFAALHILGILAVPDALLFFFSVSFLYLYKQYLLRDQLWIAVLLGINVACLLLSKYHGILIILFTLLSNIKLLRRRSLWLIVAVSILLFSPHVVWQWNNDFATIVFNLRERDLHTNSGLFTVYEYLLSIPVVYLPLTGLVFFYFTWLASPANSFERCLKFNFFGVLLFFFAMSSRGHMEPNWLLVTIIPVIYFGHRKMEEQEKGVKRIKSMFFISILLIVPGRLLLIDGISPFDIDTTNWPKWAHQVQQEAGEKPVAFMNSYHRAAEYEFYTGQQAFSINNIMGRRDQYNLWKDEGEAQGKDVLLVANYYDEGLKILRTAKGDAPCMHISNFRSSSNIDVYPDREHITARTNESHVINFRLNVQEGFPANAEANAAYPMRLDYLLFKDGKQYQHVRTERILSNEDLYSGKMHSLPIICPSEPGDYQLCIAISTGWLPASMNRGRIKLHISK